METNNFVPFSTSCYHLPQSHKQIFSLTSIRHQSESAVFLSCFLKMSSHPALFQSQSLFAAAFQNHLFLSPVENGTNIFLVFLVVCWPELSLCIPLSRKENVAACCFSCPFAWMLNLSLCPACQLFNQK